MDRLTLGLGTALVLLMWLLMGSTGDRPHNAPLTTPTVVCKGNCDGPGIMTATPSPSIVCVATSDDVSGLCKRVYLPTVKP